MRVLCGAFLLACCFARVGGRPHLSQGDRGLWVEAVKKAILESLGMDGPPVLRVEPQQEVMRRIYRLYQREVQELQQNQSQAAKIQRAASRTSTVLLPAQGE